MFRRFFWLVLGFLLGLGSSWAFSRQVRKVAQRYVPAEVADRWSGTMRAAVTEGRDAMREREAQLKGNGGRVAGK
jgi:hypothetical protein